MVVNSTKRFRAVQVDTDLGKPRLLFAEDDALLSRATLRLLSRDYAVSHAVDGLQASQFLTEQPFDLLLTDLLLPGINGMELLRLVRTYDLDIPVVLLTGVPSLETAIEAVKLGAFQYLVKPVNLEDLLAVLARGAALGRLARTRREAVAIVAEQEARTEPVFMGDRVALRARFERAMANLRLVFQPIMDLKEKKIVAYEALMRSREDSLPSPGAVLDAAERLGLVSEVGKAVRALAAAALPTMPKTADLFVNIHTAELADDLLFGADDPLVPFAHRIVLEVTERAAVDTVQDLPRRVRHLRELGFRIALDDVGAGYAGLGALTELEPEVVKIDMSLTRAMQESVVKQRVVRALVSLCREMNMRVVAEGIETHEELASLTDIGADLVQGYLIGKPAAAFTVKTGV